MYYNHNKLFEPKGIKNARALVFFFWTLMIFEGMVRKWIFPSLSTHLQVTRDFLPCIALFVYFANEPSKNTLKKIMPSGVILLILMLYVVTAFIATVNSAQYSVAIPLLGLRTHFAYFPLAILTPLLLSNLEVVENFFLKLAVMSVPAGFLAIYQSTQPSSSWINIYGTGEEAMAMFGEQLLVRATGTFSYITGMGYYAQFSALSCFYLLITTRNKQVRNFSAFAMAVAIMAGFSTGSRAVIYGMILQFFLMIILCPRIILILLKIVRINIIVIGILFVVMAYFGQSQITAFFERASTVSDDTGWRLADGLLEWIDILEQYPFGRGIGTGHQQASTFIGGEGGFDSQLPESELSRVAMELGVIGFVAFLLFRFGILFYSLKIISSLNKNFEKKILGAFAFSYFIILFVGGVFSPIANAIFWFSIGLIIMIKTTRISNPNFFSVR